MKHLVDLSWVNNLAFECEVDGHKLMLDAEPASGGENLGPRPKKLMLVALAGCTGMDVISILKKMKVEPEAFQVLVEGDVNEDHPKKYNRMRIIYQFKGKDLPLDKLERAINLSQDKYCGVSAVYKEAIPIEYEIKIIS